jgi:Protein kinase C terminal domain
LIRQLLRKKPSQRLGYENDAQDIKEHRFFKSLDWDKLKNRTYKAPINLEFSGPEDVSQFAKEFTDQKPEEKPAEKLPNGPKHFKSEYFCIFIL